MTLRLTFRFPSSGRSRQDWRSAQFWMFSSLDAYATTCVRIWKRTPGISTYIFPFPYADRDAFLKHERHPRDVDAVCFWEWNPQLVGSWCIPLLHLSSQPPSNSVASLGTLVCVSSIDFDITTLRTWLLGGPDQWLTMPQNLIFLGIHFAISKRMWRSYLFISWSGSLTYESLVYANSVMTV